jgi:hypothetical protein
MRFYLMAAAMAALAVSAPASAVVYTFGTIEPFAGGALSFTYDASNFLNDSGFIQRSSLTNVVGDIQRVRFDANCPMGGGTSACDQLTVYAGTASVLRYFANGSFSRYGSSAATFGTPASLTVAPAAVTPVPEPSTWASMLAGIALAAGVSQYRRRRSKVALS